MFIQLLSFFVLQVLSVLVLVRLWRPLCPWQCPPALGGLVTLGGHKHCLVMRRRRAKVWVKESCALPVPPLRAVCPCVSLDRVQHRSCPWDRASLTQQGLSQERMFFIPCNPNSWPRDCNPKGSPALEHSRVGQDGGTGKCPSECETTPRSCRDWAGSEGRNPSQKEKAEQHHPTPVS